MIVLNPDDTLLLLASAGAAIDTGILAIGNYTHQIMVANPEAAARLHELQEVSSHIKKLVRELRCTLIDASCDVRNRTPGHQCECAHCRAYRIVIRAPAAE